jgi:hypothetical protein
MLLHGRTVQHVRPNSDDCLIVHRARMQDSTLACVQQSKSIVSSAVRQRPVPAKAWRCDAPTVTLLPMTAGSFSEAGPDGPTCTSTLSCTAVPSPTLMLLESPEEQPRR